MEKFKVEITGTTPAIMHADNVESCDCVRAWREVPSNRKASPAGDDRYPAWCWQSYLYSDGEHIVVPSESIMACLAKAGAQISAGNGKRGTLKSATQAGIIPLASTFKMTIGEEKNLIPLEPIIKSRDQDFETQKSVAEKLGFSLFIKRAPIGNSKHVRVRPMFTEWGCTVQVAVTDERITQSVLQQLFDIGGQFCGVMDWRPASPKSPGPYGTFQAVVSKLK